MRIIPAAMLCLIAVPCLAEQVETSTVCFVPGPDDCAMVVSDELARAQRTISIQAYGFTEPHIAQALIDAKMRGVSVRVIVDKTAPNERNGMVREIAAASIPVWVDYHPRIAHNKVIVQDEAEVYQGSLNWTNAAAHSNSENLLITRDPAIAQAYERYFENRLAVSETLDDYDAAHAR